MLTPIVHAQTSGVRGAVKNSKGERLPFAAIQVKGTTIGTLANEEARYEISLPPGSYELQFQFLGHKTTLQRVEIKADFQTLDMTLEEVAFNLAEVKVGQGSEDPAYTIMRKAISMARFHQLEVDTWSARTYVKGTFRITDVPFLGKSLLKKANLAVGTTYVLESINELSFRQPNTVKEKVISVRSNLPPGAQPSINFARFSFYSPRFGDLISPLSPQAFSYYRFEYQGNYEEHGKTINKIRVRPRSRGQYVFDGTLNIVDGTWSLHSLAFAFVDENGFNYNIRQLMTPVQDVWMPVSSEVNVRISYLGAKGEGRYVTSVRNYQVKVNPKYHQVPDLVDEKVSKADAQALRGQKLDPKLGVAKKEVTRKQFKKMVRELEKEDIKELKKKGEDVAVVRDFSYEIDSLARIRPAEFWSGERQVPLTELEVSGYRQADSLYKANEAKIRRDSLKNTPKFRFPHLLTGHTYNYGKRTGLEWYPRTLTFESPLIGVTKLDFFNSVEGYLLKSKLEYFQRITRFSRWNVGVDARYSFARERLNGGFNAGYNNPQTSVALNAGRNVFQFNSANPISEGYNTLYSLLTEQNYLKLYEKSFLSLNLRHRLNDKFTLSAGASFEQRYRLQNNVTKGWRDVAEREFSSNDPYNLELSPNPLDPVPGTIFPTHNATILVGALTYRPFAKAARYNGERFTINNNSPGFTLRNRSGFGGSRFNQLEFSVTDEAQVGKGTLRYLARAGTFYGVSPRYLMDFKHFNGNQTFFQSEGLENFRLLDYYTYSTANRYAQAHADYAFRRFLLTQILALQLTGLKENVFVNSLFTKNTNLFEVGYGFSGILKTFGLEVVTTFQDGRYRQIGFRVRTPL
ncbi:MAG: carboxypeptidase-like regulatory domain-containing protein [Sphingobacteriaceae bacterium]|nr:carboxypeptidase-like regulatory domain-containing protein [Cytophagaceae bacterium]